MPLHASNNLGYQRGSNPSPKLLQPHVLTGHITKSKVCIFYHALLVIVRTGTWRAMKGAVGAATTLDHVMPDINEGDFAEIM
jgi:hypothetical protein